MAIMLTRLGAESGVIEIRMPYFVRKTAPVSGIKSLLDHQLPLRAEHADDRLCQPKLWQAVSWAEVSPPGARSSNPFRYFGNSPQVIRLVVMMYVKYPLSLRNVEDLLFERGIDRRKVR